ncbi:MAG: xanthine dehydrogenase family protein subunit M [Halanaerobium sp.]|nr:xanthine dehydrogenase family protein subunit M [Halanaerobium sp.]
MSDSSTKLPDRQQTSGGVFDDYPQVYFAPDDLGEALRILAQNEGKIRVIAGGTDILVQLYRRLYQVEGWLDLQHVRELGKIELAGDKVRIGALVTHNQLAQSRLIQKYLPILARAAGDIGSPQVRNRGTIGGNIVNASPAGDLLPPLLAYGAELKIASQMERLSCRADTFFTGPGQTTLKEGQLLTGIDIPLPEEGTTAFWAKVGKRKSLTIASLSLAVVLKIDAASFIRKPRVCFGSAAPTPLLINEAMAFLEGRKIQEVDGLILGRLVAEGIRPIDDLRGTMAYRQAVASNLVKKAVDEIARKNREGGGESPESNIDS